MKVVQINAVYGTASTGRICHELAGFMNKNGHEVYTAYASGVNRDHNTYKIISEAGIKIHGLCSRVFGLQGYFSFTPTRKLLKYISKIKPDIVHLHNLHGNYVNLPMILKYLAEKDIATVITLHDCWFFTGKCTHYTEDKCYKWKTGCNHCKRLKKDIPSWFFDRTLKMWVDKNKLFNAVSRLAVVGVSDWITNEAKKSFLNSASIIKRIYNWIDLNDFYPIKSDIRRKYRIDEDKFIILSVSAGWNESSDKFRDAIKLSKLINNNMEIVLVGSGLNKAKLPDNIVGIDYVDGKEELAQIYSTADVYVHLSREDTFGKVVAEAMACGTPAVVYNSTALPELIEQGNGFVAECGDVNKIYDKLLKIFETGKAPYSERCVDFVRKRFDKSKLLEETIKLYNDIIEG